MSTETRNAGKATSDQTSDSAARPLSPINEHENAILSGSKVEDDHADSVIFHKDWDLTFKLKSSFGTIAFKVIEVNVSSASDAFNNLLYKVNTRPKDSEWVIDLPGDNPEALGVILQIVHYKFGDVPVTPTVDEMFEICRLISKYDCTHLIQPWAENWSNLLKGVTNQEYTPIKNYKVLWVAWVLGASKPFHDMVDSIIVTSTADENGTLVHATGSKLEDLVLPEGLLDGIIQARSETLHAILNAIWQPMSKLAGMGSSLPGAAYCKVGGADASKCEMMMFASSLPTMVPAGLFPIKEGATYSGSITEIKDLIYGIQYEAWEGKNHAPHKAHTNCNLGFKDAVMSIIGNLRNPVQTKHLTRLAQQADITGVDNGTNLAGYGSKLDACAQEFKPAGATDSDESSTVVKTESVHEDHEYEVKDGNPEDSDSMLAAPQVVNEES